MDIGKLFRYFVTGTIISTLPFVNCASYQNSRTKSPIKIGKYSVADSAKHHIYAIAGIYAGTAEIKDGDSAFVIEGSYDSEDPKVSVFYSNINNYTSTQYKGDHFGMVLADLIGPSKSLDALTRALENSDSDRDSSITSDEALKCLRRTMGFERHMRDNTSHIDFEILK